MKKKAFLGAVTACVSGVAHTYMAAEALEQMAKRKNYDIWVETQGALGFQDFLTCEQIQKMDCIIIASDISIREEERFAQKRRIYINIKKILLDTSFLEIMIERTLLTASGTIVDLR